ncbi:hypothetical protein SD81_013300 [Tolypothrix campylonemoides VB511288]|nr:hypothetical protein SD81_013300 [Tolypothrix campylonemoides VB511288]
MKRSLTTRRNSATYIVKIATLVLLSLGSLGIIGGSFFLAKSYNSVSETETITDTSRYRAIRHQIWSHQTLVKHFPTDIPTDASGVRIAYSAAYSQRGSSFQLRLKQPPEKIKELLSQYRHIAKYKYTGGNTNDHANQTNGVPTTFFYTSDSKEDSFPSTYEILVLDAHYKGSSNFKWNHGDSYGVAIDSSASEIVYWAEEW